MAPIVVSVLTLSAISVTESLSLSSKGAADDGWPEFFDDNRDLCDLKRVHGPSWFAEAGCSGESCAGKMPSTPMILTGLLDGWLAMNMTWDFQSMAERFGNISIEYFDEWQQAGGNLKNAQPPEKYITSEGSFVVKDLMEKFKNGAKGQHEDFWCGEVDENGKDRRGMDPNNRPSTDCRFSLCCQMRLAGLINTPQQLEGDTFWTGPSFSMSPQGGGFAMHTHAAAWLGLISGEKAWFVEGPEQVGPHQPWYNTVLPLVLPTRAWAKEVVRLPKGQRPQFCIQRPGEVFYLPDAWWHATINHGDFALGYGTKPAWFNADSRNFHGKYMAESPGDVIAQKSRNSQPTNLPEILVAGNLTKLTNFENLILERASADVERDRKTALLVGARPVAGPNVGTAAASLCIMAENILHRRDPQPNQLQEFASHVLQEAQSLDADNEVCRLMRDAP
ncbi:unnamed protein product [Prorocentrum cordatum]|uniref:JmjC domain-containing protein n=1 Tax=Prorocentrum cordatum TaxID=2364126 RepID=A0ABN9XCP0_9DINO|nr:unnamed protein product [Polarella glacialis]|mmetsp:Transcript_114432/g.302165  ORF Transcript_114432/g.302165 Transcript_114432/m.302165 type:complete len:448 (+) Transcript_114432:64-1407(+)